MGDIIFSTDKLTIESKSLILHHHKPYFLIGKYTKQEIDLYPESIKYDFLLEEGRKKLEIPPNSIIRYEEDEMNYSFYNSIISNRFIGNIPKSEITLPKIPHYSKYIRIFSEDNYGSVLENANLTKEIKGFFNGIEGTLVRAYFEQGNNIFKKGRLGTEIGCTKDYTLVYQE